MEEKQPHSSYGTASNSLCDSVGFLLLSGCSFPFVDRTQFLSSSLFDQHLGL
jgi:hypothetical protein